MDWSVVFFLLLLLLLLHNVRFKRQCLMVQRWYLFHVFDLQEASSAAPLVMLMTRHCVSPRTLQLRPSNAKTALLIECAGLRPSCANCDMLYSEGSLFQRSYVAAEVLQPTGMRAYRCTQILGSVRHTRPAMIY